VNGNATVLRYGFAAGLIFLTGCTGLRLPSLATRSPQAERRSYDLHDPFPDEDLGPRTFSRPRASVRERADTQADRELRTLRSQQLPPGTVPVPSYGLPTAPGMAPSGPALPPPTYVMPEG
jgi:hypothetical protein